ncbi:MAG: transglutaminase domain-containing protein [Candidatus Micrarchaeota archaeon]|nr:transglutaminase domain-containing protein [Candidatus Micrarchaeota archaeon]
MREYIFLFVCLAAVLVFSATACAEELNPRIIDSAYVSIEKSGSITLDAESDNAFSNLLTLHLNMPQTNERQVGEITLVEGPDEYNVTRDGWGNRMLNLKWIKPPVGKKLDYLIKFNVATGRGSVREKRKTPPLTDLIRPDETIMDAAFRLKADNDIESIFAVNDWVHSILLYDTKYSEVSKPATWVINNRRGVCDEYSNLAVSLLRSIDYNAWYAAGWAYTGDKWESHAWVRVYTDEDEIMEMDPTWLEYPLDALHIEFVALPDSNNTEYVESSGSGYKIVWSKGEMKLDIANYTEKNITDAYALPLSEKMRESSANAIKVSLTSKTCYQGTLTATSCLGENGKPLLDFISDEKNISFCSNTTEFFFFRSPKIASMFTRYSCPIVISTSEGTKSVVTVSIEGTGNRKDIFLSFPESVIAGKSFDMTASVNGFDGIIYAEFAGIVKSGMSKGGKVHFTFDSPTMPGEYELIVFAEGTDLERRQIKVVRKRSMEIKNVDVLHAVNLGESELINVTIFSNSTNHGTVVLKMGDYEKKEAFSILSNSRRVLSFNVTFSNEGKNDIAITLFSDKYEDGRIESVNVMTPQRVMTEHAKDILNIITDFLMWLGDMIKEMTGW